jgi:hypothetical protein
VCVQFLPAASSRLVRLECLRLREALLQRLHFSPPVSVAVAGVGGSSGSTPDGGRASSALLNAPYGLALDGSGGFIFTEVANSALRWVSADGVLSTLVGCGRAGYSGDNGPAVQACLSGPRGVVADPQSGGFFVADTGVS